MRNYFKVSYKNMIEEYFFFDDHSKASTRAAFSKATDLRYAWQKDLSLSEVELRVSVKRNHADIRGLYEIGQFVNLPPEEADVTPERHLKAVGS